MRTMTEQQRKIKQCGQWAVRLVCKGQRYGLDDCLTHEGDSPLVEFYHEGSVKSVVGFISRYSVATLTRTSDLAFVNEGASLSETGLCLHGGGRYERSLNASADEMAQVMGWLAETGYPERENIFPH